MSNQSQLCTACGTMVSSENEACPQCGAVLSNGASAPSAPTVANGSSGKLKKGCLIAVGIFIGLVVLGAIVSPDEKGPTDATLSNSDVAAETEEEVELENDPGVSAAKFEQLRIGMSYNEAVAIIGSTGELMSENEIASTRTVMYAWDGESGFGANANAMFQNDELVQKAQFGLE